MSRSTQRAFPLVTVDIVVIALQEGQPQVLLIKRKKPPFLGSWAIPGGFVEPYEPLEAAARRELWEETGANPAHIEQLHTFGDPRRDPRGWTISVAWLALLDSTSEAGTHVRAASDASEVSWFDLRDLPSLAFDHADILACAANRLSARSKTQDW